MSFSAKTEKWIKQWPENVQKGYRANPYMEFIIHQYTQNLINNAKFGGVQAQPQVDTNNDDKPNNDSNNNNDGSSEEGGFGGIFDEEEEEGGFGDLFD